MPCALLDQAESVLEENIKLNKGPRSVASSFTGADGIMLKVGQMDAFTTYTPLLNNEPVMPALDADVDYNIAKDNIDNNTSVYKANGDELWPFDI